MYNSYEERALIHAACRATQQVPGVVVGVGSEIPESSNASRFRQKYSMRDRFAIYVGRIDENKGCKELFNFFEHYSSALLDGLHLVLIGTPVIPIPDHPRIHHLGFVTDQDKFDAIAASELLIMPSYFESLSMVALEAWALGRPVLANADCDVLHGQCLRSNAGLFYDGFHEFFETLRTIDGNTPLATALGNNGRQYFQQHYSWPVIERKYTDMLDRLRREPATNVMEPLPGWWARRRRVLEPGHDVVARLPKGAATDVAATAPADAVEARRARSAARQSVGRPSRRRCRPSRPNRRRGPLRQSRVKTSGRSTPARIGARPRAMDSTGAAATTAVRAGATAGAGLASPEPRARHRATAAARRRPIARRHPNGSHLPNGRRRRRRRVARAGRAGGAREAGAGPAESGSHASGSSGPRHARLRRRHRQRGARHPAGAARRGLRVRDLRRDGRSPPRGSDDRLSRAARRQPSGQPAAPPLLARVAGVTPGLCPARSDGADLPQHHAARVLHRRAPAAGAALLSRPPRTRAVCQPLRDRARRLRIQPAGARGPRLSQDRRAAGGSRLLSPVRTGQLHAGRRCSTTPG